ncbi:MAG: OmpA family protein [Bacteroidetes bacterium]|nr:OmpA family protein [Bacteroidota bacterium]
MLGSPCKYVLVVVLLFGLHLKAQKKTYEGQGSVTEIIMASQAEMVGHFDMFFNSKVNQDEVDKKMYWYKIVFAKECTFDFTLFPLYESDRYSFIAFKVENDLNFCDAKAKQSITAINDIRIVRKYADNEQSESFRANVVVTKKVPVKAGEAVYIVIKNLWGKDLGHILGLNTCDYSYVLETEKLKYKSDTVVQQQSVYNELSEEEALASIGKKLCPPDRIPIKLGTISFNKKISVSNQPYANGESKNNSQKKIIPTDFVPSSAVNNKVKAKTDTSTSRVEIKTQPGSNSLRQNNQVKDKSLVAADIFKTKPADAQRVPVRCLITDAVKGLSVDNAPVIIDELLGKSVEVKKIKPGEYEFAIEKEKTYKVECNAIGYKYFDHSINVYKVLKGEGNELELKLDPLKQGENFILRNIYFHPNTPVIKNESNKELEKLYVFMRNNPNAIISIEGHTNSNRRIGRESRREQIGGKWAFHGSAKKLSRFRADEVRAYLTRKTIEPERIKTKGWGGDRELYPGANTLQESSKNMRVEVVILKT